MKNKYKLILPVFNEEKRISKTLDYYLDELGISANLVVIDSFSSDKTKSILDQYVRKYSFITYIKKKNQGSTETQEWVDWLLNNINCEYYIFLSCSEKINSKAIQLFKYHMEKSIDLIYLNRKSIFKETDISLVYSNLIDLLMFRTTYMPLCRLASRNGLKKIKTKIHDNWLSESSKVNCIHIKDRLYSISHFKNNSFINNSIKHLNYAYFELNQPNLLIVSMLKIFREILYLFILFITFRLNNELTMELNLRIIYHLQKIGFKIEEKINQI